PADSALSQPYWLRHDHTAGMFVVAEPYLIGQPENPPAFPVEQVFEVDGQSLLVPGSPVQADDGTTNSRPESLEVISPVSLILGSSVELFAPRSTHSVTVTVTSARADVDGTLHLKMPAGWQAVPVQQAFHLKATGDQARLSFAVTSPAEPAVTNII